MDLLYFNWTAFCGTPEFEDWDPVKLNFGVCFQKLIFGGAVYSLLALVSAYYTGWQSPWIVRHRRQLLTIYIRIMASVLLLFLAVLDPILVYTVGKGPLFMADIFFMIIQVVAWLVHLGYLTSLKNHVSHSTRGPTVVIVAWIFTLLFSMNWARTTWYRHDMLNPVVEEIEREICIIELAVQVLYLFTLFPKGNIGRYHYAELPPTERTPLLDTSYSAYSRFHEEEDPYHLGVAEDNSNCLSYLTFYWANQLLNKGCYGLLRTQDDLHDLPFKLRVETITRGMNQAMQKHMVKAEEPSVNKASLLSCLHSCFGWQFYSIGFVRLIGDALSFAGPLLLHELVAFIEVKEMVTWKGYVYALTLCASSVLGAFFVSHYNYLIGKSTLKIRAGLITTVFRKVLQINSANMGSFTSGEIINMMSIDTDRIVNFCPSFHAFWSLPIKIGVTLYLLYVEIGLASIAGLAIAVLLIPICKVLANKIGKLSEKMMQYKDNRVRLITEMLGSIKTIRLNAWEKPFVDRIMDERYGEVRALAGRKYLDAGCVYFWAATPVIIPIVTFGTYIALGNKLEPARVFTAVALFGMLVAPLNAFPWVINGLVEAWVSLKRIQKLYQMPDEKLDNYYTKVPELNFSDSELQILITNGFFSFERGDGNDYSASSDEEQERRLDLPRSSSSPALKKINIQISKGQVVGIVGKVGSGKTALLCAILAEMEKLQGVVSTVCQDRGFGLATQVPWIQNGTIKDNILFGSSLDITRYRNVLFACALEEDLDSFPCRDETRVGENGSSLSGGQKARVALARAVYQNKSVYLLDDILSAVDSAVARHIMQHCIHGLLHSSTVIITTHHVSYLSRADWVILMEGGHIKNQGPPSVILQNFLTLEEMAQDWWDQEDRDQGSLERTRKKSKEAYLSEVDIQESSLRRSGSDEVQEERDYGLLNIKVYYSYILAVGICLSCGIILSLILMQATRNLLDMWLAYWVSQESVNNSTSGNQASFYQVGITPQIHHLFSPWSSAHSLSPQQPFHQVLVAMDLSNVSKTNYTYTPLDPGTKFYLSVYGILAASNTLFILMRAFLFAYGGICAAKTFHKRLLNTVIYSKIHFFHIHPLGRILNRFSTDIYTVDDSLPFQMNIFLAQIVGFIGAVGVTVYGLPWIILMYIPLAFMYYTVQHYYRYTSRDLKRLYALTLSPLYAHFTEALKGLVVIRAMRSSSRFIQQSENLLEYSQRAQFSSIVASQWLNLRLMLIGSAIVGAVALLAILQHHFSAIDPGLVGLIISYALTINNYLNGVVNSMTETEKEMISVERIRQYLDGAEPEKREGSSPPFGWPSHGAVRYENVFLRYMDYSPFVLSGISFEIRPSEKVGIIGRTGAGKSSLFSALFRLIDISRGKILIDGVDISRLSLRKLRSSMAIVPQDPFLFSGSVRENLDPTGESPDTHIWQALRSCAIANFVQSIGGLDAIVEEGGRAFSAGEKQLICLARALLSRTKIVCIDEGTSLLDDETDEHIQRAIRSAFRDKTVFIIAHRVHTVRDCDKIAVLQEGHLMEWGRPGELLSNRNSFFYRVMHSQ